MNKLYNKSELWFSIVFIVIYVVGASLCDMFSDMVKISKVFTFPFLLVFSFLLFFWIKKNQLQNKYGLCKPQFHAKFFLFYIPLLVLVSTNLWFGARLNYNLPDTILNVLTMLCVGFVEEIIFRGFLFRSLQKHGNAVATIVSSVTFGLGHIINLFSSGFQNPVPSVCQVFYAIAVGFLFVVMFHRGGSLIACIATHSLMNVLSVFQNIKALNLTTEILVSLAIILVSVAYSIALYKILPPQNGPQKSADFSQSK